MNFVKKVARLIKKVLRSVRKNGLLPTIKRCYNALKWRFMSKNTVDRVAEINSVVNVEVFDTIIIFENNFGWKKIMKQRPQQIAENLPKNALMFYHSHEDEDYDPKSRIKMLKNNLVLIDLGYYRDALLEVNAAGYCKYVMVYSTDYIPYDRLQMYEDYGYNIIYEYVDDVNEKLSGDIYGELVERHTAVLENKKAMVVCTATNLKNKLEKASTHDAALITNGVDYEHFRYSEYEMPADMAKARTNHEVLMCYYGALASWFDYELIKKIAENKKYGIVLIGIDYDGTLEKSGLSKYDNVYFLGRKSYDELPKYGCNVDICIIPFLVNDITEATSPVKLFEYMAMQRPIVTTALPECKKYESVLFSESHDEFLENIEKAIALRSDSKYIETEIREAKENDWKMKAEGLVKYCNGQRYNSICDQVDEALNESDYDRIILWRSPFGWNVPLYQRPQHIANQFSKQRCLVLYEVTVVSDNLRDIRKQQDNLYLVNFGNYILTNILYDRLSKIDKPKYIQIYSTNWSMSVGEMQDYMKKGFKFLYEYIDDISPELAGTEEIPEYILQKYNYVMENIEIPVVTTAKELYNDVVSKRGEGNHVFSCNGVDYSYFRDLRSDFKYEDSFEKIINNGKINVCYYGALASWFDYELIRKIDETNKYNVILIGIKYDGSFDESGIGNLKNVHFIGPKEYAVLKYYAAKMDILTIPFVINSITQATSPLKLFEYMALHKPIITTAMSECKNYSSVMIAEDHSHFIELLEKATAMRNDEKYIDLLDKEAKENDWSHKAEVILELLKESE